MTDLRRDVLRAYVHWFEAEVGDVRGNAYRTVLETYPDLTKDDFDAVLVAPTSEQLWELPLPDLIVETLPDSGKVYGDNYSEMAKAILGTRVAVETSTEAAASAKSSAKAAVWTAIATFLLVVATVALVIVEVNR